MGIWGGVWGIAKPVWDIVPEGMPARRELTYLCALIALAVGLGLLLRRTALIAARMLLGYYALWLVVGVVAEVRAPAEAWWDLGEAAIMAATAWVLLARIVTASQQQRVVGYLRPAGVRVATAIYGLGLIPFGVAHFVYFDRTVSMVPSWLPWHVAWASLTGGAFVAAGVALVLAVWARLAATLVALQMGLFTVLVWGPVLRASPTLSDWREIVGSWVLTMAGWVVAESYRGQPWLGRRDR